jgi:hypothetical protein
MVKKTLLALVAMLALVATAQAAVVTLTITSPSAGTWQALAQVGGGSKGISSFEINVTADSGLLIATSTNKSPRYLDAELEALVGFSYQRGTGSPAGMRITAGQVTAYSGGNDPLQDALVIQDVGILPGSHGSTSWAVPVLLASGTYTGSAGWLHVRPYAGVSSLNLLSSVGGGGWVGPGNVEGAGAVVGPLTWDYYVPEPATLALIAGGLAALTLRRRR